MHVTAAVRPRVPLRVHRGVGSKEDQLPAVQRRRQVGQGGATAATTAEAVAQVAPRRCDDDIGVPQSLADCCFVQHLISRRHHVRFRDTSVLCVPVRSFHRPQ